MKEDLKRYGVRVYLAGPFFNEEQIERVDYIEDLLDKYGFDVFSPRQASRVTPNCSQEDMLATFKGNTDNIDRADFVLAILDGKDSGTNFEAGYAYAKKVPVLYFNETRPKEKGPNLMLALSTSLPFLIGDDSREKLEVVLKIIMEHGLDYAIEEFGPNNFDNVE